MRTHGHAAKVPAAALSPEDVGRVVVDLVQEGSDVSGGLGVVVTVELRVPIPPVQGPLLGALAVRESRDGESRPFRSELITPWCSAFDDGQVARCDFALHP